MEFIEGVKVSDLSALTEKGFDLETIADRGADLILEQIFEHGFFHAGPHPGNILILPDSVICFLDYGMMGTVTGRYREHLGKLADRFSPQTLAKGLYLSGIDLGDLLRDLPADLKEIIAQIKRGRIHVEFEHRDLGPMLKTDDQISTPSSLPSSLPP